MSAFILTAHILAEEERVRLSEILAKTIVEIHHFGSTSVPGLAAKAIIDIQGTHNTITYTSPQTQP